MYIMTGRICGLLRKDASVGDSKVVWRPGRGVLGVRHEEELGRRGLAMAKLRGL